MKAWRWDSSSRKEELPADWTHIRERVKARAGGRCEAMSQISQDRRISDEGTQCWRDGSDADHIGDRFDHSLGNLQWLCALHHRAKTLQEATAARRRLGPVKRPPERHPGLR